jgi:hypothetical protein
MEAVSLPTSGAGGEKPTRTCGRRQVSLAVAAATLALFVSRRVMADTDNGYVVDRGIAIYYATIPAENIRGHPQEHPETTMHGGIPRSPHAYHVMVALFDAQTLQRITDADVTANVAEPGFAGEKKRLEKFTVADAVTFGNYFEIRPNIGYRITITVKTPVSKDEAHVEFQFKHGPAVNSN